MPHRSHFSSSQVLDSHLGFFPLVVLWWRCLLNPVKGIERVPHTSSKHRIKHGVWCDSNGLCVLTPRDEIDPIWGILSEILKKNIRHIDSSLGWIVRIPLMSLLQILTSGHRNLRVLHASSLPYLWERMRSKLLGMGENLPSNALARSVVVIFQLA